MQTDREVTRIVRSWMEEGATALPDRVLDAVLDQVPATPQRRAWWPAWRSTELNNIAKVLIAAAAVVAVAFVGLSILPRDSGVGGPSPTPSATPNATPTPIPFAVGRLDPGTYLIDDPTLTAVPFTFTVPSGWTARADGYVYKGAADVSEVGLSTTVVTHVYTDACASEGTLTEIGPTVDDLVRALTEQVGSEASTPVDISLGGYPAKRIDMSVPADLDTATCLYPGVGIQIWADPAETRFFAVPMDPVGEVFPAYIADVDGERVVILAGEAPGATATASDSAELQAILDSITFQP